MGIVLIISLISLYFNNTDKNQLNSLKIQIDMYYHFIVLFFNPMQ